MGKTEHLRNCAQKLGEQIRTIRKARGLTQIELAERANMNVTYVGDVERAKENISINKLILLAGALEVPLSELIKPVDGSNLSSKDKSMLLIQEKLYQLDESSLATISEWIDFMLYKKTKKYDAL